MFDLSFVYYLVTGFVIGAIDVVLNGGSLLMVSVLAIRGLNPLNIIATMRVTTLLQELSGVLAYMRHKMINWKFGILLGSFALVGSYFGAHIVILIDQRPLSFIIGALLLFLLLLLPDIGKRRRDNKIFERLIQSISSDFTNLTEMRKEFLLIALITFLLGIYGGFYGAAFGTILMMIFMIITKADILSTAANAKVITFLMSISASVVFLNRGDLIIWSAMIPLTIGSVVGSFIGVEWAKKMDPRILKLILYGLIIVSSIKLMIFP